MNKGTDGQEGFEICRDCGTIWPTGESAISFMMYLIDLRENMAKKSINVGVKQGKSFLEMYFNQICYY